ncbi:MAG: hypothetical protein JXR49_15965 [Acidobacteria bacterium]|nr:hypothetical protein [Acidobacteriota bacterium]
MGVRYKVWTPTRISFVLILCLAAGLKGQQEEPVLPATRLTEIPVAVDGGEVGDRLRKWYSRGTAAGNYGDYYDNRDGGHSRLKLAPYPQLSEVEYTEEQIKARQNYGLQRNILPDVVFGNSSTSASPERTGSNARTYYTQSEGIKFLFAQYARNNLYIYPEHRDHDPGHNGIGLKSEATGYGDLYPTNTPYLIVSQGSSGSDQSFMRALPYVLAAFRPEVKERLVQSGMLMPTIQMILRTNSKSLAHLKDYLTGKAHPTAMRGSDVDAGKMVEMAHEITLANIPPIALLRVVNEDSPVNGRDYFDPEHTEKLADTPAVIARIVRGSQYLRKITVSAEGSKDLNSRPLNYHWVVLRGDADRIRIDYRNESHSMVEITVPYHNRFSTDDGSGIESNRVDIGVFVHNGVYYSPPAFITFYTLDSEARTYRADGQPLEIAYDAGTAGVSVADWTGFFNMIASDGDSWPEAFLRKQFKPREIAALARIGENYLRTHAEWLAGEERREEVNAVLQKSRDAVRSLRAKQAEAEKAYAREHSNETGSVLAEAKDALDAALKTQEKITGEYSEARKAVDKIKKEEDKILAEKMPQSNIGASDFVQGILTSLMQDPNLWTANGDALPSLVASSGDDAVKALQEVRGLLLSYGVAEDSGGGSFRLLPLRKGNTPLEERLTRYEKSVIERLNMVLLSRIVFPGIVSGDWRRNYVDFRIASVKEWRDVYQYSSDGELLGWRRYRPEGIREFNAEGLLVEEKDAQGRCLKARVVKYELEPPKMDAKGQPVIPQYRKVLMIPTDVVREY